MLRRSTPVTSLYAFCRIQEWNKCWCVISSQWTFLCLKQKWCYCLQYTQEKHQIPLKIVLFLLSIWIWGLVFSTCTSRYTYDIRGRNKIDNALAYFEDQSEAQTPCSLFEWVNTKSFLPSDESFFKFCLICLYLKALNLLLVFKALEPLFYYSYYL